MSAPSPASQKSQKSPAPHWFELDGLLPYRDPIAVVGFLLLVAGVWLFSHGAALIVAGVGLITLSWLMASALKAAKATALADVKRPEGNQRSGF